MQRILSIVILLATVATTGCDTDVNDLVGLSEKRAASQALVLRMGIGLGAQTKGLDSGGTGTASKRSLRARASRLANRFNQQRFRALAVSEPTTSPCDNFDENNAQTNIEITTANADGSITYTYVNCFFGNNYQNGTQTIKHTRDPATGIYTYTAVMGDRDGKIDEGKDFVEIDYTDDTLTDFNYKSVDDLSYQISYTINSNTMDFGDLSGVFNGVSFFHNKLTDSAQSVTARYEETKMEMTSVDGVEKTTLNGKVRLDIDDGSSTRNLTMSYTDMVITDQVLSSGGIQHTENGKISVSSSTDNCLDGDYTIETTDPMITDSSGNTVAGTIVINGSTTITYNDDQTVTVTIEGKDPSTYTQQQLQESAVLCEILS